MCGRALFSSCGSWVNFPVRVCLRLRLCLLYVVEDVHVLGKCAPCAFRVFSTDAATQVDGINSSVSPVYCHLRAEQSIYGAMATHNMENIVLRFICGAKFNVFVLHAVYMFSCANQYKPSANSWFEPCYSYVAMCTRLVRKIKPYNRHQIERESELTLICFLHTTLICRMGMRFYFHDQPGRAKVKRDISSKSSCIFQCIVHWKSNASLPQQQQQQQSPPFHVKFQILPAVDRLKSRINAKSRRCQWYNFSTAWCFD